MQGVDTATSGTRLRVRATVGLLAGLALLAGACGKSSTGGSDEARTIATTGAVMTLPSPGSPTPGGGLKYGLAAETDGWDPTSNQWAGSGTTVSLAIFDRLTMLDPDGNAKPYLAQSVQTNGDFTEWTITLRPGVKFHNGQPLDAAAVKKNIDKELTSALLGPATSFIASVEAADSTTVKVHMKEPWSTFDAAMATQAGAIAAPEMLDDPQGSRHPIGTGPFVFKDWTPDKELRVEKNSSYWRQGQPLLDSITFRVVTDNTSRTASLESGDLDAIETTDAAQVTKLLGLAREGKYQAFTNEFNADVPVQFVGLNTTRPPFDDPLARQAVVYGLDTQGLSNTLYQGLFPPADSLFPTNSPFHASDTGYPKYDPVKAKELADQYREKHGKPLSFSVNIPALPEYRAIAETVQAQARDFGVDVTINSIEQTKLIVDALTGNFDATGFVTFGDTNTDRIFIASETIKPVGQLSLNFTRNDNPRLTQALNDERKSADRSARIAQWKIVQQEMAKDLSILFLVHQRAAVAFTNSVFGLAAPTFPDGSPVMLSTSPLLGGTWKQG